MCFPFSLLLVVESGKLTSQPGTDTVNLLVSHSVNCSVTGILVLKIMVPGPKFSLKNMVPWGHFFLKKKVLFENFDPISYCK